MATAPRFCLDVGSASFLLSAKDGATVLDILADARQIDSAYGFPGRSHRDALHMHRDGLRLSAVTGELVTVDEQEARRERERLEREAADRAQAGGAE
jgi:hypothetical protein